jgi:hypothetical protein
MALNKAALQSGLAGMGFDASKASELATIIDDYVKGATVNSLGLVSPSGPVTGAGTLS